MKLLHISASPRGAASESLAIASTLTSAFLEAPDREVDHWDLWDGTLPEFGPVAAAAKMAVFGGRSLTPEQAVVWRGVRSAYERFVAADAFLFSVPMWNAGVPYILKQFIDVVSQPGMVFDFDPEIGYTGLVEGRKAAVVYTSAVYGEDRGLAYGADFQTAPFADWLRWAGVKEVAEVRFRPNLVTRHAEAGREAAHARAARIGATFF